MEHRKGFDPYQIFTVDHLTCTILTITVKKGKNISNGWQDYVDTPDPYVQLRIPTAPTSLRRTKHIDNDTNPEWNETFTYYLDHRMQNTLEVTLWEANYTVDKLIGTQTFDINQLIHSVKQEITFTFDQFGEVDMELQAEYDANPTLRYSLCLSDAEKEFKESRRQKCMRAMQNLLGDKGPKTIEETPTIGILGSGGGFRAMVALTGVLKALSESGVIDCATYMTGLSGSSWCLSTLYSHPDWPNLNISDFQDEMKNNIDSSLFYLMSPNSVYRYIDSIVHKRSKGQPVSFTDFFGHLVGETILKGRLHSKLSDQRKKIENGNAPMPLYTCVHVKKDVSAQVFHEWMEFTPYEIGMPKYGTFMDSTLFGSKFFMGQMCQKFDESPLHFLQGIWGSAFCILFKRLSENNKKLDPVEMVRIEMEKELENEEEDESDLSDDDDNNLPESPKKAKSGGFWRSFIQGIFNSNSLLNSRAGRAGVIHNFMRGLSLNRTYSLTPFIAALEKDDEYTFEGIFEAQSTEQKKLYVVDAGLTFNSPYPMLLRPQRGVNLLLSFDFSARPSDATQPFKELLLAEKWAKYNRLPFPPIDPEVFVKEGMKELYIFRHPTDQSCPIVMHFVLVNIKFRDFKAPGVPRETEDEREFANFNLFEDPDTPYSTFNFTYPHGAFERLSKLTEFNTLLHIDDIKQCIVEVTEKSRANPQNMFITLSKMKMLEMRRLRIKNRMCQFIRQISVHKTKNKASECNDKCTENCLHEKKSNIIAAQEDDETEVFYEALSDENYTPEEIKKFEKRKTDYFSTSDILPQEHNK